MAYFQIEKNTKKRFFCLKNRTELNENDFKIAAQSLVHNAKEYHTFILRASNKDLNNVLDVFMPFLSNCGLVCELLLKAILCYEQKDYIGLLRGKNRHSLYELFKLLAPETQREIISQYPYRYVEKDDFKLHLEENAQVFYELRYSTEYSMLAGSAYFIPDLMVTLQRIVETKEI